MPQRPLDEETKAYARELRQKGWSLLEISQGVGISTGAASNVCRSVPRGRTRSTEKAREQKTLHFPQETSEEETDQEDQEGEDQPEEDEASEPTAMEMKEMEPEEILKRAKPQDGPEKEWFKNLHFALRFGNNEFAKQSRDGLCSWRGYREQIKEINNRRHR